MTTFSATSVSQKPLPILQPGYIVYQAYKFQASSEGKQGSRLDYIDRIKRVWTTNDSIIQSQ